MALPRKGSRSIEVDGARYRWHIRRRPTGSEWDRGSMHVGIERVDALGVLYVDCVIPKSDALEGGHGGGVTPAVVRVMIERAIAVGWSPGTGMKLSFPLSADVIGLIR